jgi:hypothetical protein
VAIPPAPDAAKPKSGEQLIGQWEFPLELKQSPVARILTRFILTNERLVALQLPTARVAAGLSTRLSLRRPSPSFLADRGKWHVLLDAMLSELPEPTLGRVPFNEKSALPSDRALILGAKHFPVGEDLVAEGMVERIRGQWAEARRSPEKPLP